MRGTRQPDLVLDLSKLNADVGSDGRAFAADGRMAFMRIAAGEFTMGARGYYPDEEPPHRVTLTRDFFLAVYPVTGAQFAAWRERPRDWKPTAADHPATGVSWLDAKSFCGWLNGHPDVPPDCRVDLPTEAQWEYACRGGIEGSEYDSGNGEAALDEVGWYAGNSEGDIHPVGEKAANPWRLFDMHGNVDEWCRDAWDEHAYRRRLTACAIRSWIVTTKMPFAWSAAVPGSAFRRTAEPPFATSGGPTSGSTSWAFAWACSLVRTGPRSGLKGARRDAAATALGLLAPATIV